MSHDTVIYRGRAGHTVEVVTKPFGDGRAIVVGPLPHHRKHSPDGFSWGYFGSGPAELARCLLIDALGSAALCAHCHGQGEVHDDLGGDDQPDGSKCFECWGSGIRPEVERAYQAFKQEVVAGWPMDSEWEMSRDDILTWLAGR